MIDIDREVMLSSVGQFERSDTYSKQVTARTIPLSEALILRARAGFDGATFCSVLRLPACPAALILGLVCLPVSRQRSCQNRLGVVQAPAT